MSNKLGQVTFEPAICKPRQREIPTESGGVEIEETPARFKGTVTIKMPDYDERIDLFEELGVATASAPQGESDEDRTKLGTKLLREAARRAGRFVLAIDLERLEDGFKFSTWEEVRADSTTHSVVSEVGMRLIGRYELGKN